MTRHKVGREETHLDDLDDEFSGRLTQDVRAKASVEPNTGPPCSVRLVVLEFSGEEDGDGYLEDSPLDHHHRNETDDSVRCVPHFQVPKELKEGDQADNGSHVRNSSHYGTELIGVAIQL